MTDLEKTEVEDENNLEETETETEEDKTDYKSLYEQEKERGDKYEGRFKKTAKELNERKKSVAEQENGNVAEIVSKQVQEEMFYANNPIAKEYQKEIREIQGKTNMSPEDAMTFYLAKNKPELIGKQVEVGVDGVSKEIEQKKNLKEMTYEELRPNQKQRG